MFVFECRGIRIEYLLIIHLTAFFVCFHKFLGEMAFRKIKTFNFEKNYFFFRLGMGLLKKDCKQSMTVTNKPISFNFGIKY